MRTNVFNYGDAGDSFWEGPRFVGFFYSDKAERFPENTRWNGNDLVSVHSIDKWAHQSLYRTAQGRWVIEQTSQWQGVEDKCWYVDDEAARNWLLINGDDEAVERLLGPLEAEQGPGRPSIGPAIPIKFPPAVRAMLDAEAGEQRVSVSELVRSIVEARYAVANA